MLTALVVTFGNPEKAQAIPAFARAYNTPCTTCHIAITRRGEFGDAFRRLGFHWPGAPKQDSLVRKETPIEMRGTSLLTGMMPSRIPLSLSGRLSGGWSSDDDSLDTISVGSPSLNFLFGSALGEHVSFFGTWAGAGSPNELYLHFARILGGTELNLKVGRFEQWTTLFKNNEALLSSFLLTSSGVSGHSVGQGRIGAEASGVVFERGFWAAGVVQNGGPGSHYDSYYHLSYKLGGMDFLGEDPEVDFDAEESIFDNTSLVLGHWGYWGEVADVSGNRTSDVRRLGIDLKLTLANFNLWGGFMLGADYNVDVDANLNSHTAFVEASYPVTSWFVPLYVFQVQDSSNLQDTTVQHDVGALVMLMDNLRARLRYGYSADGIDNELAELQLLFAL